jgi:hypothetical protein
MSMRATGRIIEVPITAATAADFLTYQIRLPIDKRPVKRIFFGDTDTSGVGEGDGVTLGEYWQLTRVRSERTDTGETVFGMFREVWL